MHVYNEIAAEEVKSAVTIRWSFGILAGGEEEVIRAKKCGVSANAATSQPFLQVDRFTAAPAKVHPRPLCRTCLVKEQQEGAS